METGLAGLVDGSEPMQRPGTVDGVQSWMGRRAEPKCERQQIEVVLQIGWLQVVQRPWGEDGLGPWDQDKDSAVRKL